MDFYFFLFFCPKQKYLLSHMFVMLTTYFNICEKRFIELESLSHKMCNVSCQKGDGGW